MIGSERGIVVGGGSIGRRHAANLQSMGLGVAVVDPDPEVREGVASDPDVSTFAELSTALDTFDPAFVVCAPNGFTWTSHSRQHERVVTCL
jgi:phosphoglycerate dehydrogenase-like enzyme